eukprot:Ihof_evm1s716 gene=Ihof_evmTU1s716
MENTLGNALELLQSLDIAKRLEGADLLTKYLETTDFKKFREDALLSDVVFAVGDMIKMANHKVCRKGLDTLQALLIYLGHYLRSHLNPIHVLLHDRLATPQLRDQIHDIIDRATNVVGPRIMVDRLLASTNHKLPIVRQQIMVVVDRLLSTYGGQVVHTELVTAVCQLVDDQAKEVRDEALKAIGTMYTIVDDRKKFGLAVQRRALAHWDQVASLFSQLDLSHPVSPRGNGIVGGTTIPPLNLPVRRKTLNAVKKPATSTIDEEKFTNFDDCPPLKELMTEKRLEQSVTRLLTLPEADWDLRCKALRDFRCCLNSGAASLSNFNVQLRRVVIKMEEELIPNLRSQVVKECCMTVAQMSFLLRIQLEPYVVALVTALLKVLSRNLIFVDSANMAITQLIKNIPLPKIADKALHDAIEEKSADLRVHAAQYTLLVLQSWDKSVLSRCTQLEKIIKIGVEDATPACRVNGRQAFWAYHDHYPERAEILLSRIEQSRQKDVRNMAHTSLMAVERGIPPHLLVARGKPIPPTGKPQDVPGLQQPIASRITMSTYTTQTYLTAPSALFILFLLENESLSGAPNAFSSNGDSSFLGNGGPGARGGRGAMRLPTAPTGPSSTPHSQAARSLAFRGAVPALKTASRAYPPTPLVPTPARSRTRSPQRGDQELDSASKPMASRLLFRARKTQEPYRPAPTGKGNEDIVSTKIERLIKRLEGRPMTQDKLDVFVTLEGLLVDPQSLPSLSDSLLDKMAEMCAQHIDESNPKIESSVLSSLEKILPAVAPRLSPPTLLAMYIHLARRCGLVVPANRNTLITNIGSLMSGQNRLSGVMEALSDTGITERTRLAFMHWLRLPPLAINSCLRSLSEQERKSEAAITLCYLSVNNPEVTGEALESLPHTLCSAAKAAMDSHMDLVDQSLAFSDDHMSCPSTDMFEDTEAVTTEGDAVHSGPETEVGHSPARLNTEDINRQPIQSEAMSALTNQESSVDQCTWEKDEWEAMNIDYGENGLGTSTSDAMDMLAGLDQSLFMADSQSHGDCSLHEEHNNENGLNSVDPMNEHGLTTDTPMDMDEMGGEAPLAGGSQSFEADLRDIEAAMDSLPSVSTSVACGPAVIDSLGPHDIEVENQEHTASWMQDEVATNASRPEKNYSMEEGERAGEEEEVYKTPKRKPKHALDLYNQKQAAVLLTPSTIVKTQVACLQDPVEYVTRQLKIIQEGANAEAEKMAIMGILQLVRIGDHTTWCDYMDAILDTVLVNVRRKTLPEGEGFTPISIIVQLSFKVIRNILRGVKAKREPCISLECGLTFTAYLSVLPVSCRDFYLDVEALTATHLCLYLGVCDPLGEKQVYDLVVALLQFHSSKKPDNTIVPLYHKEVLDGVARTMEILMGRIDNATALRMLARVLNDGYPDELNVPAAKYIYAILDTHSLPADTLDLVGLLPPLGHMLTHGGIRARIIGCSCLANLYNLVGPSLLDMVAPYLIVEANKHM